MNKRKKKSLRFSDLFKIVFPNVRLRLVFALNIIQLNTIQLSDTTALNEKDIEQMF